MDKDNRANRQERVILIQMYKILPILWTFKNIAQNVKLPTKHRDKQSVKQAQATAAVQSVLLVLEDMHEDAVQDAISLWMA